MAALLSPGSSLLVDAGGPGQVTLGQTLGDPLHLRQRAADAPGDEVPDDQRQHAGEREQDDEARRGLFRRVVRAMALDLPALPLVYPISALATGPRVASYPTSPQLDEPFARVRLTEG